MSAFNDQICPICKLEDWSDLVEIRQKGADGINEASVKRGDSIVFTAGMKYIQSAADCTQIVDRFIYIYRRNTAVIPVPIKGLLSSLKIHLITKLIAFSAAQMSMKEVPTTVMWKQTTLQSLYCKAVINEMMNGH